MRWTHAMRARLRLLIPGAAERRMDEEMRFHLEMATEENLRAGMSPGEARRRAMLAFGGVEGHKEDMREGRTLAWTGGLSLDLKLAVRMLRKYPGLTVIGGMGMALGVAISAGFFSAIATFAYPTLPLEEGDRIVALESFDVAAHNEESPSLRDFVLWREELESVRDVGAFRTVERNLLAGEGVVEPVRLAEMTAAGFQLARVPPLLGRYLVPGDELPGAPPVLVIGYDAWQERFAGDPAAVGRQLRLDGVEHTVVGVMPEGFAFPVNHDLWIPLRTGLVADAREEGPGVFVFGRLAPGARMDQAAAELTGIGRRMAAASPETHARLQPTISPYTHPLTGMERGVSVWELAQAQLMVSLLLIVIALNVAVLVYARTATRRGEIAVRSALGASRRRIVGQLFAEALVLSLGAAAVGFTLAQLAFRVLIGLQQRAETGGGPPPFWLDFGLRPTTVAFTIGLAVLAAVIVGVVPALQATGKRLQGDLRQLGGSTGVRLGRTWTALVIAQVAVAAAALPYAVNMGWTQISAAATRPTYAVEELLSARLELDAGMGGETGFADRLAEVMRRLEAEPAVTGVSYRTTLPDRGGVVRVEDVPAPPESPSGHRVAPAGIQPGYFEVLGPRIVAGRGLGAPDLDASASAVVVNEAFVRQVLGGGRPLGRRVRHVDAAPEADTGEADGGPWYEIVGVVQDLEANAADPELVQPALFYPVAPARMREATLAIRLRGTTPADFGRRLREITAAVDPSLRLGAVGPLADENREVRIVAASLGLLVALGLLTAFLLSAAGVYALMSLAVTQRRREIGIRAALGASPWHVLRSVFTRAATQIAIGLAVGIGLAALAEGVTEGQLMGGNGAVILPALAAAMTLVGLFAALGPARRGLRIEPMEALRGE